MRDISVKSKTADDLLPSLHVLKEHPVDRTSQIKTPPGKRLSNIVSCWENSSGTMEIGVATLLGAMSPFDENAIANAYVSEYHNDGMNAPQVPDACSELMDFDIEEPCLRGVEGALEPKMDLRFKILVDDVVRELLQRLADGVPSLAEVTKQAVEMSEKRAALMKSVPQAGIGAVTCFRVGHCLADSSCLPLEAEALKRLDVDIGSKKAGRLGEFVLLLQANDLWKLRYRRAQHGDQQEGPGRPRPTRGARSCNARRMRASLLQDILGAGMSAMKVVLIGANAFVTGGGATRAEARRGLQAHREEGEGGAESERAHPETAAQLGPL